VAISVPVLVFAFLLTAAVAAGLGTFTAIRATSGDVRDALVEGGRGQAGSPGSQRVGRAIVAAQIAVTLVLVVGAGLFARSLMKVLEVNPGFRVDGIVAMDVALPWLDDPNAKAGQAMFFARLIDRLRHIPGVRNVGATSGLPLVEGGLPDGGFLVLAPHEVPPPCRVFSRCSTRRSGAAWRISASRRPDTFRCWEFPWSEAESSRSVIRRTRRTSR
jgi:hypothetical protein